MQEKAAAQLGCIACGRRDDADGTTQVGLVTALVGLTAYRTAAVHVVDPEALAGSRDGPHDGQGAQSGRALETPRGPGPPRCARTADFGDVTSRDSPSQPIRRDTQDHPESKRFSIRYRIHSARLVRPQSKPNSAS